MYGPSTSRSSAPTVGMLTAFVTSPPSSAAATCSATITPARSCASSVEAARCGVTTTFGAVEQRAGVRLLRRRRRSRRRRPCPTRAPRPARPSTSSSPRAALTMRTPSRIFAIAAASIAPRVSSFSGRCSVRKSARASTSSNVALSTPSSRNRSADDERVVGDDLHLQPERAPRDLLADPAEAEHAERLVGELDPAPLRALPAALDERRVRLRDVARERDQQADRVLGRRDDVRLRRVRDDDPAPGRGVDVDVVDADPGAADHLQARARARSGRRSASSPSG